MSTRTFTNPTGPWPVPDRHRITRADQATIEATEALEIMAAGYGEMAAAEEAREGGDPEIARIYRDLDEAHRTGDRAAAFRAWAKLEVAFFYDVFPLGEIRDE